MKKYIRKSVDDEEDATDSQHCENGAGVGEEKVTHLDAMSLEQRR